MAKCKNCNDIPKEAVLTQHELVYLNVKRKSEGERERERIVRNRKFNDGH